MLSFNLIVLKINEEFILKLKKNFKEISLNKSYSGEVLLLVKNNTKEFFKRY